MSFRGNLKKAMALRLQEILTEFHSCDTHDCKSHGNWAGDGGGVEGDPELRDFLTKALNKRGRRNLKYESPANAASMSDAELNKHYADQGFDAEESKFLSGRARSIPGTMGRTAFVNSRLATGADLPSGSGAASVARAWKDAGITAVIDNRSAPEAEDLDLLRSMGFKVLANPTEDEGQKQTDDWFDRGVDFALAEMRVGGKVLSHCHEGCNRGPSMAYAIMLAQGENPDTALANIKTARPVAGVRYSEDALAWWNRNKGRR